MRSMFTVDKRNVRLPGEKAWALPRVCVVVMALLFVAQTAFAGQVTILSPREDTRVDFERLGLRVATYSREQLVGMDQATAISLGQSIDASVLVLTGAQMPAEAFEGMFGADEVRVALDDLFRRGGMLFIGQISGGIMNDLPSQVRDYFDGHDLFLPMGTHRPTSQDGIGHFTAHANPDLLDLPILSQPHSLAEDDWAGVKNNIFYWRNFPDSVLPILLGPDGEYPVMLLQKDILGNGMFIISQARDLTRAARSPFWENLVAQIDGNAAATADATNATSAPGEPIQPTAAGEARPLLFLNELDGIAFENIGESNLFTTSEIWEDFEQVELSIYNTGDNPEKPTQARLGVIGEHLVAAFHCVDPSPEDLTAHVTSRDGEAWTDDSVELVVVPREGGPVHHWIVSASGAIYDAKDRNSGWDSQAVAHVQTQADGWRAVLAVPIADVFEGGTLPETFQTNLARQEQAVGEISSWVTPIHAIPSAQSVGHVSRLAPRELAARLVGRPATDQSAARGEVGFDLWQASPWDDGLGLSSRPADEAGGDSPEPIELHVPRRGSDAAVLLVRNRGSESLVFKVEPPRELKAEAGESIAFYDVATLYRGVPRLSSYETLGFDPLESLGNASLLSVPPGETAMLWVDISGNAAAGRYRGELSLVPITVKEQTPMRVALDLRVYETQIPDPLPLNVYAWGPYMAAIREKSDPLDYVEMSLDSHINTFNVSYPYGAIQPGPEISSDADDYLTNVADYLQLNRDVQFVYSYHLFRNFDEALQSAGFTGEPMDEQWQSLFIEWFGQWMNALEGAGVTYDDYWIQVEDEPRSKNVAELAARTALLKEHFPRVRTMVTVAPWATAEDLEALEPYIDLWAPERRRVTIRETASAELDFYRQQDAFWPYRCSRQMDMQPLMSYYRQRGIQEHLLGVDGIALWAFNSWGGNPWAQWDAPRSNGGDRFDEALVYRGEHGPVPSTRLFAFRAGIEDYVLLHLLSQAKLDASDEDRTRIGELTDQAEGLLEGMDPAAVEQWRRATLSFLDAFANQ